MHQQLKEEERLQKELEKTAQEDKLRLAKEKQAEADRYLMFMYFSIFGCTQQCLVNRI